MEGSNNGKDFETLLEVKSEKRCFPGKKLSHYFKNDKAFKFYRLNVIDVPGRSKTVKYLCLEQVQFFGTESKKTKEWLVTVCTGRELAVFAIVMYCMLQCRCPSVRSSRFSSLAETRGIR